METQDSETQHMPPSQTTLFQSRDGNYMDQSGNIVNLSAYGIDVTKGVLIECVPDSQCSCLSQNDTDDEASQSILAPPGTQKKKNHEGNLASQSTSTGRDIINILPRSETQSLQNSNATQSSDNSVLFVGECSTTALPTFSAPVKKGKPDYTEEHIVDVLKGGDRFGGIVLFEFYYVVQFLGYVLFNNVAFNEVFLYIYFEIYISINIFLYRL